MDWGTFQNTEVIPYKVTLNLKLEQYVGNGMYKFHLKNEVKIIPNHSVCFYALNLLDAIQCFNKDEVIGFKIEYNY